MKITRIVLAFALALFVVWQSGTEPRAASNGVVISQVYGGGGNSGATLKNDFIELFNRGTSPVSLNGWSVQYAASTGTSWTVTNLTNVTLQPGQYYLIQESAGAGGTTNLPTPDATGAGAGIAMSATAGKVALVSSTTALSGGTSGTGNNSCPTVGAAGIVDLVGYGTGTSCFEGAVTPTLTNTTAAIRALAGCTDTDTNSTDFSTGTPSPRNTASPTAACSVATNPTASGTASPSSVVAGTSTQFSATVTGGLNPSSTGLAVSCNLTSIGGSATFSLPFVSGATYSASYLVPLGTAVQGYSLPCTVTDTQSRSGTFNIALTIAAPIVCETGTKTSTAIHTIQGSGLTSPLAGQTVEAEGIVVASFRASTQLLGFYLQEPDATWDADPLTSEGIFIFDNGTGVAANVGDRVRVRGTVSEFSGSGSFLGVTQTSTLTEIGNVQDALCSTGNAFTVTTVTLPTTTLTDLERYEGMAVSIPQQLVVTGNFSLGTFGQIDLAPTVQYTPTAFPGNTATWTAQLDLIKRSVLALDDFSTLSNANLFPVIYPQGNLSAADTLRSGDIVNYNAGTHTNTPLFGILDDRFGAYRIEPTAPVTFFAANPRPDIAPILTSIGGRFRAVSANVLNFFTTFNPPGRGAANQGELDHQKTKIIEALFGMNGDVYGLSEVQNDASGNTGGGAWTNGPLQSLVDGLNCKYNGSNPLCASPSGPFALIDTLPLGGSNGTDAIRSAIIYRSDRLVPVGGPAEYYQNDTNRPSLAQTFKPVAGLKTAQQTFTLVVNHFRSKGSACGGGQDDPLQGSCNGLRLNMATNVVSWLAGNPTADPAPLGSRRLLLIGDFNAYYGEDPIQYLASQGFVNLINKILGPSAYSYNFGSQRGYLDHALANGPMNPLVKSVAEWHNNSDEPSSLEALGSNVKSAAAQVAYYAADPYAASDHDPIVIAFNTLLGDLNDDGVVSTADQALLTGAVGKNAADVDRRMDYDGDGKITLNDYRLWTAYYRAFIQ